jgi:hypothetical protein
MRSSSDSARDSSSGAVIVAAALATAPAVMSVVVVNAELRTSHIASSIICMLSYDTWQHAYAVGTRTY